MGITSKRRGKGEIKKVNVASRPTESSYVAVFSVRPSERGRGKAARGLGGGFTARSLARTEKPPATQATSNRESKLSHNGERRTLAFSPTILPRDYDDSFFSDSWKTFPVTLSISHFVFTSFISQGEVLASGKGYFTQKDFANLTLQNSLLHFHDIMRVHSSIETEAVSNIDI